MIMYKKTKDEKYLEKAFLFSESNKAGSLSDGLASLTAKNFGTVPEHLKALEKKLKDEESFFEDKVQEEESQNPAPSNSTSKAHDELFRINRSWDSLVRHIEKNYPQYYQLKYVSKDISLKEFQQKLDPQTAIIEYFIGDSTSYAFVVTRETLKGIALPDMNDIQKAVAELRSSLNPVNGQVKSADLFSQYVKQGYNIYTKVLANALESLPGKSKLVIIPDGHLNYIPFDALLSKSVQESTIDYRRLPYVLNNYQISYAYSAMVLFNNTTEKRKEYSNELLAFAPQYETKNTSINLLADVSEIRSKLTSLSWNQQEIENIHQFVNGVTLVGSHASEYAFKEEANKYGMIHLAMHALIDDERPMQSKLAFSLADTTGGNDGFLNAYELYNMELSAKMVVLSACETGYGKLARGEGIMSLAHAFTYAGCPSVVMSHWVADDKATAQLMELFYKNIAAGIPKDEALRQAKLTFIQQADDIRQNPAFWAGFVVLGDTSPIHIKTFYEKYWIYFAVFVLILGTVLIYTKRKKEIN
jgi:CHAT domain-containing protein